jgi:hypothetical protein
MSDFEEDESNYEFDEDDAEEERERRDEERANECHCGAWKYSLERGWILIADCIC